LAKLQLTTSIAIVGDELPATSFAAEALFVLGSYAILNNVARATPRTSDFFVAHQLKE
jgi:hypothetical protein